MRNVPIKIFLIAKTRPEAEGVNMWLQHLRVKEHDQMAAEVVQIPGAVAGIAAKRCYLSFEPGLNPNVTRVRKGWFDYFTNVLNSGHGSVLEHITYSFAIEGVSRVFTGEVNRHRAGVAISEGSMRYIRFADIPWWSPLCLEGSGPKQKRTTEIFNEVFEFVETKYKELLDVWEIDEENFSEKKKITSMLRRIIPMGVATGGIWTFNIRALRHIIALRTSSHAEEEIAYVISKIAKRMVEEEPLLMQDFKEIDGCWVPDCEKV